MMDIKEANRKIFVLIISLFVFLSTSVLAQEEDLTDSEIKQIIIQRSIENYPGNCPCPFNRASNGSRCGGRSAWSKPGGYSPKCYERDVSSEEVEEYRERNSNQD